MALFYHAAFFAFVVSQTGVLGQIYTTYSPGYPYTTYPYNPCYSYYNQYNLAAAQACANSNGNQASGSLALQNNANVSFDPASGSFQSVSQTGNSASGGQAQISSNTNANAFGMANPNASLVMNANVNGNTNSNGHGLTGSINNLDQANSVGQGSGALVAQQSSSSINATGTGVTLSSNANGNGNAYAITTTSPPYTGTYTSTPFYPSYPYITAYPGTVTYNTYGTPPLPRSAASGHRVKTENNEIPPRLPKSKSGPIPSGIAMLHQKLRYKPLATNVLKKAERQRSIIRP